MAMGTAKLVVKNLSDWNGTAHLYELSPPLVEENRRYEFVVVSAVVAPITGPETYIFGSNKYAEVVRMSQLPGSYRGGYDHETALNRAGYEVIE